MTKIAYEERRFAAKTALVIEQANEIMKDYGSSVSLRQLYYQFVARDLMENTNRNYKKLGDIIRNGRMAGLISWDLLADRTRGLRGYSTYDGIGEYLSYARWSYKEDLNKNQDTRVEIWVEKDALSSIVSSASNKYRIDFFPTKGYPSIDSLKKAADRLKRAERDGKDTLILYLSDHDPEGLHMPQAVQDSLHQFGSSVTVERIGLTLDQVRQYNPPSSFAKESSSRYQQYVEDTGTTEVWELDALKPDVITGLIHDRLDEIIDQDRFDELKAKEERGKEDMQLIADNYQDVLGWLKGNDDDDDEDEWDEDDEDDDY